MEQLAFYGLYGTAVVAFVAYFAKAGGYMQVPTLVAAVYLGWVLPQLSILRQAYSYYPLEMTELHLMALVCLGAVLLGWSRGIGTTAPSLQPVAGIAMPGREERAVELTALAMTGIAVAMTLALSFVSAEERNATQASGIVTIIKFFSNVKVVSLFLSMTLLLRRGTTLRWALLLANLAIYAPLIVIYFRRQQTLECALALAMAFWFARGTLIPRLAVIAAMGLGGVLANVVGQLRQLGRGARDEEWSLLTLDEIMTIDFSHRAQDGLPQAVEMSNALHLILLSHLEGLHTYGTEAWNRFVFQYVPAQFVGGDVKQALMIDHAFVDQLQYLTNHTVRNGSTLTGIGTAYVEFWFFGGLLFLIPAYLMGRLWRRAVQGDMWAQAYIVAGTTPMVLMVTHQSFIFYTSMLLFLVMLTGARAVFGGNRVALV
ncbi:MAG: hypothetical protein AAFV62_07060 [Pseudomonadota bacterium]